MAFRYINPGYVSLLDSDSTKIEVTNTTYSKTGVAFYLTNTTYANITLPTFAENDEFWARFDFYPTNSSTNYIYCYVPYCYKTYIYLRLQPTTSEMEFDIYLYRSGSYYELAHGVARLLNLFPYKINTFSLHVNFSQQLIEVTINETFKYTSNSGTTISYSTAYQKNVSLTCTQPTYFSNVIFSDVEISPREQIIALPISSIQTDMTAGDNGIYIANAADQILLQTPNLAALSEEYGADSKITSIQVVGNPAYKTGTGLTTLTALSKADSVITEHGTCDLSDDTVATIHDGWSLSNTTLADLQSMQFGWRAGE